MSGSPGSAGGSPGEKRGDDLLHQDEPEGWLRFECSPMLVEIGISFDRLRPAVSETRALLLDLSARFFYDEALAESHGEVEDVWV